MFEQPQIDKSSQINNRFIKQYSEELQNDMELNLANIRDKSLTASSIRAKWLIYFFKERENLEKLKSKKKSILESKMTEAGHNLSMLALKKEESIINNNDTLKKLNELIEDCNKCIDFLERAIVILNDFGFAIKNAIELIKLEQM